MQRSKTSFVKLVFIKVEHDNKMWRGAEENEKNNHAASWGSAKLKTHRLTAPFLFFTHVSVHPSSLLSWLPLHSSVHFSSPRLFTLLNVFPCLFPGSFRRRGGRGIGAGQGAYSANSREAYGQVQSQGRGDAVAVLRGWRGEISHLWQ